MADAWVRLCLVRPGRGRLVRVMPADPYAFEAVAHDARSVGPDGRLEVRWDGPPSEHARRVRDLLARLAERGVNVRWISEGEPGNAPERSAEPRSLPEATAHATKPAPTLHRIGDLVSPADLPRPFVCRVVAAESCAGSAPGLQLLVLEPLEGPWSVGTRLLRTSDVVERIPTTGDAPPRTGEPDAPTDARTRSAPHARAAADTLES